MRFTNAVVGSVLLTLACRGVSAGEAPARRMRRAVLEDKVRGAGPGR